MSDSEGLPHGAKRIAMGEATVVFLEDKLVFSPNGSQTHWTVHFGPYSGEMDIHVTTASGPESQRERLFSMPRQQFARFMSEFGMTGLRSYRQLIRRLRPGWMVRRQIGAVLGLIPTDDELEAVTTIKRRKLVIDPEKFEANVRVPTFINELYELGDGYPFTLLDWRRPTNPRRVGTGFKTKWADGSPRLVWVRDKDIGALLKGLGPTLVEAAKKYGTFHKPLPWTEHTGLGDNPRQ